MSIDLKPLLGVSRSQNSEFKSRVKTSGQECIILVHPFQSGLHTSPLPKDYTASVDEVIASSFTDRQLLIIAEEAGPAILSLKTKLAKYGDGTVYILPTRPRSPRPESPFDWQDLKKSLSQSGVNSASLGGQRLEFASMDEAGVLDEHPYADWFIDQIYEQSNQNRVITDRLLPFGCVGMLMCELMTSGINIEISRASYPQTK